MSLLVRDLQPAGLDFETSDPRQGGDGRPSQIGIALTREGRIDPAMAYCRDIATSNHSAGADYASLWPDIRDLLTGRWIIAHGAGTERRMLRTFPSHRFGPWIDTLTWSRRVYPTLPSHRLGDLIALAGLEQSLTALCPGRAWHDALYDATAAVLLFQHLVEATGCADQPAEILL